MPLFISRSLGLALLLVAPFAIEPARAGLILHLAADQIDLNDPTQVRNDNGNLYVQQWNDVTPNATDPVTDHATQTTDSNQPLYVSSVAAFNNQPALQFDGADDFLQVAHRDVLNPGGGDYTGFIVGQTTSNATSQFWMQKGNSGSTNPGFTVFSSGPNANTGDPPLFNARGRSSNHSVREAFDATTEPVLISFTFTGSELEAFLNGDDSDPVISDTSYTGPIATVEAMFLGKRNAFGDLFLDGFLAEIQIYDGPLSASERQAVTNLLGQKYGLIASASSVPEPATLTLLALGLSMCILGAYRKRGQTRGSSACG